MNFSDEGPLDLCSNSINKVSNQSFSSDYCEEEVRPFVPEIWIQILWSIFFSFMVVGAVVGNLLVIYIILSRRSMRTKTNIFFLNLSIADLTMALFNAMFNFIYMITNNWTFGFTYCKINNFLANLSVASSVFTITATSIDRYIIVVYPLRRRMSKKMSFFVVLLIWALATLMALPALINSRTVTFPYASGEERTICTLEWPDGYSGQSEMDNIYNMLLFLFTYLIPMTCMGISYYIMAKILWGNEVIGEMNTAQHLALRSKQKVVPMLIIVTVVFAICWLPYHLYFLYIYYDIYVTAQPIVQHLYLGFYFLAMTNAFLNPIIYCLLNQRFRRHFQEVLRCCKKKERRTTPTHQRIVFDRHRKNSSTNISTHQENLEML